MQMLAAFFGEAAGQDPQQLVQVRTQGAVGCLLDAEVFEHRHAARTGDAPRGRPEQTLVDSATVRVVADRHGPKDVADLVDAGDVLGEKCFVAEVFLHQDRGERRQAPRVRAGLDPQVEVGQFRGVGEDGVDHDHRATRVLGDLVEHHPGPRKALRHPRVLADEHRDLGVLELPAGVAAVEMRVDPRLAGLLLGQRVGTVARADRLEERSAVGAAEVVSLSAAAVVEDLVSAVRLADPLKPVGDLRNRGVPVDFLIGAVIAAAQRCGQPARIGLVVVQLQGFVAGVPARGGVVLVAADLGQLPVLGLHDDPAVALAEDAGRGFPGIRHLSVSSRHRPPVTIDFAQR